MKLKLSAVLVVILGLVGGPFGLRATTIQFVADNDFAVFTGTLSGINRLIYQNNSNWEDQIAEAASFSFNLQPGEDTFYVLAMGSDGNENISGSLNGVNIARVFLDDNASVFASSNLVTFLSGRNPSGNDSAVGNGTYNAQLADMQAAFSSLTWGTPTLNYATVVQQNPYAYDSILNQRVGFGVPDNGALLFRFSAESVGVDLAPIPEPATYAALAGLAALGLAIWRRRSRK